jgi:hypothetical protein
MKPQILLIVLTLILSLCGCIESKRDALDASGSGQLIQNLLFSALLSSSSAPSCESAIVNGGGKCIFVTTTPHNGNFDNSPSNGNWIEEADAFCLSERPSNLTGTYKAFMVSELANRRATATPINWVLAANTSYYRYADKKKIGTTDAARIFPSTLENSLGTSGGAFWTGISTVGTYGASVNRCNPANNWESASSGESGYTGHLTTTTSAYITNGTLPCDSMLPVLCAQQ